jgi:hypothetical protein
VTFEEAVEAAKLFQKETVIPNHFLILECEWRKKEHKYMLS